jgi:transcriptional regulator with XRE-family HTH domain
MRYPIKLEVARARMTALGLTQQELAARCAVDVRTVQRWFAGQSVGLGDAERVAAALGVGTSLVFAGIAVDHEGLLPASLRRVLRVLSGRENAFAQGLGLAVEHYDVLQRAVSFAAHPTHGYVTRVSLGDPPLHGFAVLRVQLVEQVEARPRAREPSQEARCALSVHAQLGPRFSFSLARVQVRDTRVELLETFCTRSMVSELSPEQTFDVWLWGALDSRELLLISEQPVRISRVATAPRTLFELDAPETRHAVCIRPSPSHLRRASLPPGFDRIAGDRTGRVELPLPGP